MCRLFLCSCVRVYSYVHGHIRVCDRDDEGSTHWDSTNKSERFRVIGEDILFYYCFEYSNNISIQLEKFTTFIIDRV